MSALHRRHHEDNLRLTGYIYRDSLMMTLCTIPSELLEYCISFLVEDEQVLLWQVSARFRVPVMEWMLHKGHVWTVHRRFGAYSMVQGGHLDMLMFAFKNGCPLDTASVYYAAKIEDLKILQYLYSIGGNKLPETAWYSAAAWGQLDTLKWLLDKDCPWDERVCAEAARHGYLDVLKWLRSEGCPWDKRTCMDAATEGHFEVLKWARHNGCKWDKKTISLQIAFSGNIQMMKWARSKHCWWDAQTCARAACGKKLEMLKWLHRSGCPWDSATIWRTLLVNHIDMAMWFLMHGCSEW